MTTVSCPDLNIPIFGNCLRHIMESTSSDKEEVVSLVTPGFQIQVAFLESSKGSDSDFSLFHKAGYMLCLNKSKVTVFMVLPDVVPEALDICSVRLGPTTELSFI